MKHPPKHPPGKSLSDKKISLKQKAHSSLHLPFMKKQRAFTLIELMITMAIIAILATAGIQAYTGYIKKGRDTARSQIAQNLNSSVMAYAASNGGNPPATPDQFTEFLASAGETFGGGSVSGGGLSLVDPIGGKEVCLDAAGTPNQPCRFDYTAYTDGTYAISYGVEDKSSTKENFYKTTESVAHPTIADTAVPKYGVYIGSAPFVGSTPTAVNGDTSPSANDGVDVAFTPIGAPAPIPMIAIPFFLATRIDTPTVTSGDSGGGSVTCNPACTNDNVCTNGTCTCGGGTACSGNDMCVNNTSCVVQDPCEQPGVVAGIVCLDNTVYVNSTLRTTSSDVGGTHPWLNCAPYGGMYWEGCVNSSSVWIGPGATGANNTADGRINIATLKLLDADLSDYPAAMACDNLIANNYNDWYLPSLDELTQLANNRFPIGNFVTSGGWPGDGYKSSTEITDRTVWTRGFTTNLLMNGLKHYFENVRCVRRP